MVGVLVLGVIGAMTVQATAQTRVRIGLLALPHYLLPSYAKFNHYDQLSGVDFDITVFPSGPPMMAALARGDLDIGLMGIVPVINAAATRAFPFYLISVFEDTTSVMSLASMSPDMKSLQDLKGKTLAVPLGTGMHFFLQLALRKAGLTDRDMRVMHMEPADAIYAMTGRKVDVTVPFGGYVFAFLEQGGWPFFWGYELWETKPVVDVRLPDMIVTSKAFGDRNPRAVVAFLSAFYRAVDDYTRAQQAMVDWEALEMQRLIGVTVNPVMKTLLIQRPTKARGVFEKKPSWILWTAEQELELLKSGKVAGWMLEAAQYFASTKVIPRAADPKEYMNLTFMEQLVELRKSGR
jgi:ABC-type nitrate/sulfonate/bicarbonate transport system substrate-binding protein